MTTNNVRYLREKFSSVGGSCHGCPDRRQSWVYQKLGFGKISLMWQPMGLAVFAQKTRRSADRQFRKTLFLYVPLTASATHHSSVGALISTGFRDDDEIS